MRNIIEIVRLMKIAVFSDPHYSDHPNLRLPARRGDLILTLLDSLLEFLNREYCPDLVICAGDLLDDPARKDLLPDIACRLKRTVCFFCFDLNEKGKRMNFHKKEGSLV